MFAFLMKNEYVARFSCHYSLKVVVKPCHLGAQGYSLKNMFHYPMRDSNESPTHCISLPFSDFRKCA